MLSQKEAIDNALAKFISFILGDFCKVYNAHDTDLFSTYYKEQFAKENIEKSLMVNPNSAVVLEHLGDIYNAMKDYPGALKYWKLSLEKNPNNVQLKEKIDLYKIS